MVSKRRRSRAASAPQADAGHCSDSQRRPALGRIGDGPVLDLPQVVCHSVPRTDFSLAANGRSVHDDNILCSLLFQDNPPSRLFSRLGQAPSISA
jgi:hypothetical protein